MPIWLTIIISILGSAAVFSFVEFLISRSDKKKGDKDAVLVAVNELKTMVATNKKDTDDHFLALENRMAEERATNARIRILGFSDEIMHGMLHSEESFNQALADITAYEKYCAKHPDYKNARAKVAIGNINTVYEKCVREGSFLGMR